MLSIDYHTNYHIDTKQQLQLKSSKYKDINENVYTCIQVRQAQRSGSEHNIT